MPTCPGHVDFVPGHVNCCGYVPDWASDFPVWACTYFFSSIHKLYRACIDIGWARQNFAGHIHLKNHVPDGHVNEMLNVNVKHWSSPTGRNGRHFADDNYIFLNQNDRILIRISLKFVPRSPADNIPLLVQIMAWCQSGDKPVSEPMLTHFTDIDIEGILPKGPYPPCLRMADTILLAG